MTDDATPYIVEFNWKREQFHMVPLKGRLKLTIRELLCDGKPTTRITTMCFSHSRINITPRKPHSSNQHNYAKNTPSEGANFTPS